MKVLLSISLLLMLAACSVGSTSSDDDGFSSADTDSNARANDNSPETARKTLLPLTSEERANAALLVSDLDATDEAVKNTAIRKLVALGPRYLEYFKLIKQDSLAMDMMYIVHRIESEYGIDTPEKQPEPTDPVIRKTGNAGEPDNPAYTDVDDFDRGAVEQFMASRLSQAQFMLTSGRPDMAIRIAQAALTLLPDTNLRPDFEAVIIQGRNESQADLLIAGSLDLMPSHLQYESMEQNANFRENLQIRCFLKNVSANDITLLLYDGENKESVLVLTIQYEQHDYAGNVMAQIGNVRLPVREGNSITLKPNQSYELVVPLESLASLDKDASRKTALGIVRIKAALRVYGALNEDDRPIILRPVVFPTRIVKVFPHSFDLSAAEDSPLSELSDAISNGDAQGIFMCANLLESDGYKAAGDLLLSASYDDSPIAIRRARLRSMHTTFKVGKIWDIEKWREWWQQNRRRQ